MSHASVGPVVRGTLLGDQQAAILLFRRTAQTSGIRQLDVNARSTRSRHGGSWGSAPREALVDPCTLVVPKPTNMLTPVAGNPSRPAQLLSRAA